MIKERPLEVGDKVKCVRQTGKNGVPQEVVGTIERFSKIIQIDGEPTAVIRYSDNNEVYSHKASSLKRIAP